mmetsp:Transcript_11306/g.21499  ORF Transcript_11306/g.21499 Transcript_11306/m.21499 type:complete len:242 (+) Transcript_11306:763-1488(+)
MGSLLPGFDFRVAFVTFWMKLPDKLIQRLFLHFEQKILDLILESLRLVGQVSKYPQNHTSLNLLAIVHSIGKVAQDRATLWVARFHFVYAAKHITDCRDDLSIDWAVCTSKREQSTAINPFNHLGDRTSVLSLRDHLFHAWHTLLHHLGDFATQVLSIYLGTGPLCKFPEGCVCEEVAFVPTIEGGLRLRLFDLSRIGDHVFHSFVRIYQLSPVPSISAIITKPIFVSPVFIILISPINFF